MLHGIRNIRPRWLRLLVLLLGSLLLLAGSFLISVSLGLWGPVPGRRSLADIRLDRASEVYTADSVLIGKFYLSDRQPVPLEQIPQHTVDALVSIEDERFYQHSGIDYPSLIRVFFKTILLQDAGAGGGSTLSQQLVKNLYPRRRGGRLQLAADKVREMMTAIRLERLYDKNEILELYLNTVSFGDNSFGIESAARKFFNKPAAALHPEESATLIGMLKATHGYNPRVFPEAGLARRNLVLDAMARNRYLPGHAADSLKKIALRLDYKPYDPNAGLAPYFREAVRKQMAAWLDSLPESDTPLNLYTSGLKIYTTLDYRMQELAEAVTRSHMKQLQASFEKAYGAGAPWLADRRFISEYLRRSEAYRALEQQGLDRLAVMDSLERPHLLELSDWDGSRKISGSTRDSLLHYAKMLQTGQLAIDAHTGAVLSWVGGIDYAHFKFDHVSQSRRQVGSVFKPVVYTAALESGIRPCEYFQAREIRYENLEDWTPSNASGKDETFLNYSMQEALRNSVNTVAVKVLEKTGIPRVLAQARALGIHAELPETPALALGAGSIGIPEVAGAYASFVNGGRPLRPYSIVRVTDRQGRTLFHRPAAQPARPAYSEQTRQIMLQMLQSVVDGGTAARLRTEFGLTGALAGKTGTTQNNKDAWFVALTPRLVHVSWVGLESHELGFPNTRIGQGAHAALPLFAGWYQRLKKEPALEYWTSGSFSEPDRNIRELMDCPPVKRDGFFKRLFSNPAKTKTRKFQGRN